jgi:hypothetical protein
MKFAQAPKVIVDTSLLRMSFTMGCNADAEQRDMHKIKIVMLIQKYSS